MDWATVKDVLLAFLAVYGAVLSTVNWRNASRRDLRLVKVKMDTASATYFDGSLGAPHAKIEAVNVGHRAVTISSLYIELPGRRKLVGTSADAFVVPDTPLPAELKDGGTASVYMAYTEIADAMVRTGITGKVEITPVAADTSGGIHRGTPWNTSAGELMATVQA